MNVLVLGGSGMAGHVITLHLREQGHNVNTLSNHKKFDKDTTLLDVTDTKKLEFFLNEKTYDVVVNCIALLVKESEANKILAAQLNAVLPLFLENHYVGGKTKVVHISTDSVFSGDKSSYVEDDLRDGQSFYGRSKALGELDNDKDITFRLSIVGPSLTADGTGLFHWFSQQKGKVNGFTNALWTGITTIELAQAIQSAIEQNATGLYHLVPLDSISKFDLLQLFRNVFGLTDIDLKPTKGPGINTVLISARSDFDYQIPSYETMVQNMKAWIEKHPEIYKHYDK